MRLILSFFLSGAHHIVDSSEWSFQQAAEGAMEDGNVFYPLSNVFYPFNF